MANQTNNGQGAWQLAPDEQFPTDQAQMKRDDYVNLPSDVPSQHQHQNQNQNQPNSFVQGTGNQAKNVAQGAKTLVQGVATGASDIATGAATGVGNVAHGAASGTTHIAQGAAGAVKSTFGLNNNTGNSPGLIAMDDDAPGSGAGTAHGIDGPTDSSNSNARG